MSDLDCGDLYTVCNNIADITTFHIHYTVLASAS